GGFVFPDFGRRDKRVTAWFASEATSYDSAMTIATNPKRDAEAVPIDELGDGVDTFAVSENGEGTRALTLTRAGDSISITQEKLNKPAEPGPEETPYLQPTVPGP
ncbi:MAG: hypothetical protein ACR2K6_00785, partial [Solirubrobacterales bacterium]